MPKKSSYPNLKRQHGNIYTAERMRRVWRWIGSNRSRAVLEAMREFYRNKSPAALDRFDYVTGEAVSYALRHFAHYSAKQRKPWQHPDRDPWITKRQRARAKPDPIPVNPWTGRRE